MAVYRDMQFRSTYLGTHLGSHSRTHPYWPSRRTSTLLTCCNQMNHRLEFPEQAEIVVWMQSQHSLVETAPESALSFGAVVPFFVDNAKRNVLVRWS
ncbi:hypothetical protein KC341_g31 [Hortaea werneckii]|nr:hypothetical protein KC341_g31 [Hortaea werneckii]